MIDLTIYEERLAKAVGRARERGIIIPTFAQMRDPSLIPEKIKKELKRISLWEVNPRNLFRITWKNEPVPEGGGFDGVNYIEFPSSLTGVDARIVALVGKWFPTGSHKVGATFGCLVPRLVTGQFDPTKDKAVWPSTGNYCRGGAYDATLLACESIAILPEGMSRERFEWLASVAGEVIATPGSESNVKEIFDKTWELRRTRDNVVVFNQFDEFGNYLWHYDITGHAMEEVLGEAMGPGDRYAGVTLTTGSAGTIACGDYLKQRFPTSRIAAGEALQCPTLLENGFGAHRIEGIGDKHVPWIHNLKHTDMIVAIDDEACMSLVRLFNEPAGRAYLVEQGVPEELVEQLDLLEELADTVSQTALCGLGKTAPNPVLTTLRYFRPEYEAHIREKKCPAGVCKALITYWIDPDRCTGCGVCLSGCAYQAITGSKKQPHVIDTSLCQKCGVCQSECKFDAIRVS